MLRTFFSALSFALFLCQAAAQTDDGTTRRQPVQYLSPADADLEKAGNDVAVFSSNLASLKKAFEENNTNRMIAYEAIIVSAMRNETEKMDAKAKMESARVARRKQASTGQITTAVKPEEAPARDPFAEATTPTEIRLEKMQYTLAAFERHSFDPGQPEVAARDFAKLDDFLQIMQAELAELKQARGK